MRYCIYIYILIYLHVYIYIYIYNTYRRAYWSFGSRDEIANCEEMKLCKILSLNVKLKNDENKLSPIMTGKWEENVLKCNKREE